MNLLIIAGEISADIYAAKLAESIKKKDPSVKIYAVGGQKLSQLTDFFIADVTTVHAIGITELLRLPSAIQDCYDKIKKLTRTTIIDLAIILDFGHYNFKFAALLQSNNISIYTFITPNFWVYKNLKQARKLVSYSQKIITIFPGEYDFYRNLSSNVYYFGHPLVQFIPPNLLPKPQRQAIGIFPGSRKQELRYLLKPILQSVKLLKDKNPELEFYLSISANQFEDYIKTMINKMECDFITLIKEDPKTVYRHSTIIISATGTASLESMLYERPVVVLGALSPITYWICIHILKINMPYAALPNIITQSLLVPEFIQNKIDPIIISAQINQILESDTDWQSKYTLVRSMLTDKTDLFNAITQLIC